MTDIVERLRTEPPTLWPVLISEAADEIERLQDELHSVHAHLLCYRDVVEDLRTGLERLRASVKQGARS